jgi:acyl-coenzyme A thioesterase PaaI-like protein
MTGTPLNKQFIYPGNMCFGCGPDNPEGLRIAIYRDGERTDRLVGTYRPRATAAGFPGIVHGGAQFTALDCMAGWAAFILRNDALKGMPLTTTATMRFKRGARVETELRLYAEIARESDGRAPFLIKTGIVDSAGEVLSEADYEYMLVPQDKFKRVAGIEELPDHYVRHFGSVA